VLVPLNKYITVEPVDEDKTDTGVLIPEGVKVDNNPFKVVDVVKVATGSTLESGMRVVVPSHMVETTSFFGQTHYLVLENHVVGYLKNG
tara:strand:+ start:197 stop:463 length:267 start_codon:yes stop_codon:yes gene_type:complete